MSNSEKGVSERIQQFRKQNNITIQQLADALNFPKGTLEKYLNGPKYPNAEFCLSFSAKYGVSIDWLLEGVGPVFRSKHPDHSDTEISAFVPIRRFDVEASAGNGSATMIEEETGQYAFKRQWLERRGLKLKNLSVISVSGDSMEPDLRDGDLILIDHSSTELADGGIYAVQFSGALYVKRIQHLPGEKVHLISKNTDYPPIEVAHPEADGVKVIGRIVASMHEW